MTATTTTRRQPWLILWVLTGALLVLCVLSLAVGAGEVGFSDAAQVLIGGGDEVSRATVLGVRVPRTLLGIVIGAALAVSGALIQAFSRNPLADPGILGATAGASTAMTIGATLGLLGSQLAQLSIAFFGAAIAGIAVYLIGRDIPSRLVLAGTALSAVLMGVSLLLRILYPDTLDAYRYWSVGTLAGREQANLWLPVVLILLALLAAMLVARQLDTVALGDDVASTLGARLRIIRPAILLLVTLLAGLATAAVGPIVFLGLIAPHIARRILPASVPWLCAFSLVLGPIVLIAADIVGRVLLPTGEVPVAIPVAFLGAIVLIGVVRRYGEATL